MEKTMKDYIVEKFEEYRNAALQINEDKFTNDVLKSFKDAKTYRHYVLLIPADLDEYYNPEEQNAFNKNGYYKQTLPDRFDNRFFIPPENIKRMADLLTHEEMIVTEVFLGGIASYAVTLNSLDESYFNNDYSTDTQNDN